MTAPGSLVGGYVPRTSRTGEATESSRALRARLPEWVSRVTCPVCQGLMVPIRAKKTDRWGDSVTLQCHNTGKSDKPCLTVSQVTTTVNNRMVAEDFGEFDFDWRKIVDDTQPADTIEAVKESPITTPTKRPFVRNTIKSNVWDQFWLLRQGNHVDLNDVREAVVSLYPDRHHQVDKCVREIPRWLSDLSGYRVVLVNDVFLILTDVG